MEGKDREALRYIRTVVMTGTAASFTARNPTLLKGQLGYESDTRKLKVGNGTTAWNSLGYAISTTGGGVSDHGALSGLGDDDHSQYHNDTRGDLRYTQRANNLSDLANADTARTNLGLGSLATVTPTGTPDGTKYLRDDGSWQAVVGGSLADGDKGDITVSGSGATWTIDNGAVTLAKMEDRAEGTLLGRDEGAGTGAPQELTPNAALGILDFATDPYLRTSAAITHPQVMSRAALY